MIIALPFCSKDADQLLDLLLFIRQLGGCPSHDALLVADAGVDWAKGVEVLNSANETFRSAGVISTREHLVGWPQGANELWLMAARYAQADSKPFLWLEPDCVPLQRGWIDEIQRAYSIHPDKFMGYVYAFPMVTSQQFLSGIAVYPPDAVDYIAPCVAADPQKAFDVSSAPGVVPQSIHTTLIQHFFGREGLSPTFCETRNNDSPEHVLPLSFINPDAVLFHRNKDGTLIGLLRRKFGLSAPAASTTTVPENIVVVLPFFNGDAGLLLRHLEWMSRMGMPRTHDCLLSYEANTQPQLVKRIAQLAATVFLNVRNTVYQEPHGVRFPQTFSWQHAAHTMQRMGQDWLWMEADMVALKPNWLGVLQNEYNQCGKLFMGSVIHGVMPRGHVNGTAIYPANTPEICPRTMSHTDNAFDVEMSNEMMHLCHDAGGLMFHVWGIVDGRFHPLTGDYPVFPRGTHLLRDIPSAAVTLHRCKDGSLIDRLIEK